MRERIKSGFWSSTRTRRASQLERRLWPRVAHGDALHHCGFSLRCVRSIDRGLEPLGCAFIDCAIPHGRIKEIGSEIRIWGFGETLRGGLHCRHSCLTFSAEGVIDLAVFNKIRGRVDTSLNSLIAERGQIPQIHPVFLNLRSLGEDLLERVMVADRGILFLQIQRFDLSPWIGRLLNGSANRLSCLIRRTCPCLSALLLRCGLILPNPFCGCRLSFSWTHHQVRQRAHKGVAILLILKRHD